MDLLKKLQPGTIVFFDSKGFIGNAIKWCQNHYVRERYGSNSQWSHAGWVGCYGNFYESTLKFSWFKIVNGYKCTPLKKRFKNFNCKRLKKEYHKLGFQTLKVPHWKSKILLITLHWEDNKKLKYGALELIGTLMTIAKWKMADKKKRKKLLQNKNPFDSSKKVYCIAAVSDRVEDANVPYLNIDSSNATVDEGLLGCASEYSFSKTFLR